MKSYAGIGSRETPQDVLLAFERIGEFLAKHGYALRSGHAQGADQAFEHGCDKAHGQKEIYLPWKGFEWSTSSLVVENPAAFEIAAQYHPKWAELTEGGKKLQARNSHQVLGLSLDDPCDFVVCWTKDGNGSGGTGQAIRIAKDQEIPIFDAGKYNNMDDIKKAFNTFYSDYKQNNRGDFSR